MYADPAITLTCRDLVELVTDHLDGALAPADRARFETHLELCAMCQVHLQQLRTTLAQLGRLQEDDIDPIELAELQELFGSWAEAQG